MWNPSTCDWECDKACKIDKYLDIKNCSCDMFGTKKLDSNKIKTDEMSYKNILFLLTGIRNVQRP